MPEDDETGRWTPRRRAILISVLAIGLTALGVLSIILSTAPRPGPSASASPNAPVAGAYPWHTGIVSTTFWVGEVFDPNAADGS